MARRSPPPPGPAVNITSLCDIMLSLLIFFMLVSKTGVDTGADPTLDLPLASLGITEDQVEQERAASNSVVVNVRPSTIAGNPQVYGKFFSTGEEWSMNVRNVTTNQREFQKLLTTLGDGKEEFEIVVYADAGTPFLDMEAVLQAVNVAQPTTVKYPFKTP